MPVGYTPAARSERLSPEELESEIATLAAHIYAGTCRWLELVAEFEERGFSGDNCTYPQWLAWRCGLTPRAAREHVRVARALTGLPEIHAAFSRGELSYAKVRALTRVASAESEGDLLPLARAMTASQLERALRTCPRVTTQEARALQAAAYVGWYWNEDGSLVVKGRLAPEDGVLFLRALGAGRDVLRERESQAERGSAEPRQEHRPTNAEALVAMSETALAATNATSTSAERHQVVVHLDASALAFEGEGGCALEDGPAIAPETARRLTCDSSLVQILERDGEPLSVGGKTRAVPPAIQRALRTRDHGCRFPGCDNRRFVDAHHIRHWARGGETKLDNLVLLCRRHHRLVHEGGYTVERPADGDVAFRHPWGEPIPSVPRSPPGSSAGLAELNSELEIDARTYYAGYYDRMDLDLAVEALAQALR
jgi:hypothetical protein